MYQFFCSTNILIKHTNEWQIITRITSILKALIVFVLHMRVYESWSGRLLCSCPKWTETGGRSV